MECYLCGSIQNTKRSGTVRDNPDLEILECKDCGLVFPSSGDHIDAGFYEQSGMIDTGIDTLVAQDITDIVNRFRDSHRENRRRLKAIGNCILNKRVLDFGCGEGGFIKEATEISAMVHGVEPEERLRTHFKEHGFIVYDSIDSIPKDFKNAGYDIITLFHVLEHFTDPIGLLRDLSVLVSENGSIILEVPSADDALLTLYESRAFSDFTYWSCHLFLFKPNTIRMLAEQAGYVVEFIRQVQRYPLSNHLHWLAKSAPGGHEKWAFIDSPELNSAYESRLAALGKCDTLMVGLKKGPA